ncbi:MAG: NAD-dependent epimerase/dehydratase family protein [Rickettsiella sp.]|nr:NAD-dependent epimerase/dehydratase family protein [Rickettsiella sp.]
MKIFITGGAGFIGSHLTDYLLTRGDEVMVIDNYATGRRDNLKKHVCLQIIEGSIANNALIQALITDFKPELIIHAAASYKDPSNWQEDTKTNVLGTVNVIQAAKKNHCPRIIYFQTALCYGLKPKQQPITLDHPLDPANSSYAITKTSAEQFIQLSGLNTISFRLANAYGPRNISGPLPSFYQRLTEKKSCFVMDTRRDFIYIDDLVDCVIKAINSDLQGIYHIASGGDYSIKELFDATLNAMSIQLKQPIEIRPRNPDDAFTILLDPNETQNDLNWKSTTPLQEGIKHTIHYYQKYGIKETYTHLQGVEN